LKEIQMTLQQPYRRFAIFIDGASLNQTTHALGLKVDFQRLLNYFAGRGSLLRAFYFTLLLGEATPEWLTRLTTWLSHNGYCVITKPGKVVRQPVQDENGVTRWVGTVKGSMDIELTVEMMTLAPHLDTVVLISGRGDLVPVVEGMKSRGVRVIVVSSISGAESAVANELRREADEFIDLATIADHICMVA
jgi:uncharacterized LabA/DUF88 family protein